MKTWRVKAQVVIAAALLFSGLFTPNAFAAASSNPDGAFNLVVVPVSQDLEVKPSGVVSTDLKLQNKSLDTEHVQVTLMKFGANGQDGTPALQKMTPADDYANWVTFSQTHFDAEPNVWTNITMTVKPPKTAAFGYYYAVVFSRAGQQTQQKQANLLGAAASLILLDVQAPGAVRRADISEFSTDRKSYEFLPATFTVRLHNTGNVHIIPRGNIFITKGGQNVAMLGVNDELGNILPKTYRKFTAAWQNGTPVYIAKRANGNVVVNAQDKPVTSLNWSNFNLSKLRFGEYHAKLVMVYNDGEGDVSTEAQLNFWVIPWRIIGVALLALVLVGGGLWALLLRPIRQRLGKRRGGYGR